MTLTAGVALCCMPYSAKTYTVGHLINSPSQFRCYIFTENTWIYI